VERVCSGHHLSQPPLYYGHCYWSKSHLSSTKHFNMLRVATCLYWTNLIPWVTTIDRGFTVWLSGDWYSQSVRKARQANVSVLDGDLATDRRVVSLVNPETSRGR